MDCVLRSNVKLHDHQIKVVENILDPNNNGLLVVHFCGMGKSLSAIASSQGFLDSNPMNEILVICGKSLVPNFKKEMCKYGVTNAERYHFYTYSKIMHLYKRSQLHTVIHGSNVMLIVDEVHNIKNHGTKTYIAVFELAKRCRKRLLLTATPFVNSHKDFIAMINLIHGAQVVGEKKDVRKKLARDFIVDNRGPVIRHNNKRVFIKYLKNKVYYLNISSTEHFPDTKEHYVSVQMTPEYEQVYDRLMKCEAVNSISFRDPEVFYNGHRRAVNTISVEYDKEMNEFTMKLNVMLDKIKEGKTMIYTNWIQFGIEAIVRFLEEHGITYRSFYGQLTQDERAKVIQEYNAGDVNVLIITKAGGEGIDLMETRNVIILDPTWNPTTMVQIKSRAVRYKSHVNLPKEQQLVNIYYMMLVGSKTYTGDMILYAIIKSKEEAKRRIESMLKCMSI